MSRIKISGIDQYLHENLTWQRTLDFYLQENAFLKTRLSQVLDSITDKEFLALAEHFQNSFIHNDECMKDLQADIKSLQGQLKVSQSDENREDIKLAQQFKKLRNEMGYYEKNFGSLKNEFNQYLSSFL